MSTLDRISRNWTIGYSLPDCMWKHFEEINPDSLRQLITSLECSVSNGWMGVAAEISEYILLAAADLLDQDPLLRLRVEIERLKRFAYLGFDQATRGASKRVLSLTELYKGELPKEDRLVWESVAVGSIGWIAKDPHELRSIIEVCTRLVGQFDSPTRLKTACDVFICALVGRLGSLTKDSAKCHRAFKVAIDLCERDKLTTPLAHIRVHNAESLMLLGERQLSTDMARQFLLQAHIDHSKEFRSHLILRAIVLLLEAYPLHLTKEEFVFNVSRYNLLVHAMGLAQSQTLYPLLERAKRVITTKGIPLDLNKIDWRSEVNRQIGQLSPTDLERLVKFLYEAWGYSVIDLPSDFPAFDLIAMSDPSRGPEQVVGIQVKSGKGSITKSFIPDELVFVRAKELLDKQYGIKHISVVSWFTLDKIKSPAFELLNMRIKAHIGKDCKLESFVIDDMVGFLQDRHEILFRLFFSNEWDRKN